MTHATQQISGPNKGNHFKHFAKKVWPIIGQMFSRLRHHWMAIGFLTGSVLLIYWGYSMMRPTEIAPVRPFIYVGDHASLSESNNNVARLKSIDFRHICRDDMDAIQVSFSLRPGTQSGFILIECPFKPRFEVLFGSRFTVSMHSAIKNAICINYNSASDLQNENRLMIKLPPPPFGPSDCITYELPGADVLDKQDFGVSYAMYPDYSANVSVNGSPGNDAAEVRGLSWPDLRKITRGTTVTVATPRLRRNSQRALAFGAILISLGANFLTSYIFSHIGPKVVNKSHVTIES